ncbi:hypothetical protein MRX96_050885 [Rhipicephalus microplus]
MADYVRCNSSAFWHAIEANERLILPHIIDKDTPSNKYSVTIKPDLSVLFHYLKVLTQKLGRNISISDVASEKKEIAEVLEAIEKWDHDLISTATTSKGDTVETVRALLAKLCEKEEEDDVPTIKFLIEQLNLLSEKRYILNSGNIIFPHLVTIRSVCSSYKMNRQLEHQPSAFLRYTVKRISDLDDRQDVLTIDNEVTVSVEDPKYELVKELDRRGLVHPSIFAVNAVAHSTAVVDKLLRRDDFFTIPNQPQVATDLTVDLLTEDESSDFDGCDGGHTKDIVLNRRRPCVFQAELPRSAATTRGTGGHAASFARFRHHENRFRLRGGLTLNRAMAQSLMQALQVTAAGRDLGELYLR